VFALQGLQTHVTLTTKWKSYPERDMSIVEIVIY